VSVTKQPDPVTVVLCAPEARAARTSRKTRAALTAVGKAAAKKLKPHDDMRTMREYIADGMGCSVDELPGLEAAVLALAVEAKYQRTLARARLVLLDRARAKLPTGSSIYRDICEALRVAGPTKKSRSRK